MKNRRQFLKVSALGSVAVLTNTACNGQESADNQKDTNEIINIEVKKPIVVSTWNHGMDANKAAWEVLSNKGSALDAVEAGVRVTESDADNMSVGLGGLPDRDGIVTLDACIMDHKSNCGAVAFLQNIENPISVARKVMEDTPHVMLAGEGALMFAKDKGFKETNLLTDNAKKAWEEWMKDAEYKPVINIENHDTIGMLALDEEGNLSGACTTSGLAYKMHGRVGDSPIIGAGLFVDNEVGAACATGVGEAVIRTAGSAMVVELMRQGKTPEEACKEVIGRIISKHENIENIQVGFIALNKNGEFGCYGVHSGFNIALRDNENEKMVDAKFELNK
ncbi:N(4)-(beta-N-acetylglucosaminyl)-L-asparaginase [Paracrocinitomix mangrovi]|uniref:isoaspartyl peptidase/L-asparaginase family protein n=1 Tax=Paracrocinitomix mangrovi TaxID=2862509 RepID=UPI001C8E4A20|nr:N(4)-(beta-N-acetylglucosaminyl)-L-asparaginase [Paracrocinitomix mangrovi]UKN02444.1 N(4)-(beta-N-acetylglucosaminyl)-L-asparaginase [Paracrocinitomix mangrovi]